MAKRAFNKKNRGEFLVVPISFSLEQLDTMIIYLFTNSVLITRKDLSRMMRLFRILDPTIYEKEAILDARFKFIRQVLDCRLRLSMSDYNIILDACLKNNNYADIIEDEIIPMLEEDVVLNDAEIKYVATTISDHLNYCYLFKYKDKLADCLEELELGSYGNLTDLNDTMKTILVKLMKDLRTAKPSDEEEQDFDLSEDSLNNTLLDAVQELKQPSNYLETGIQMLNKALNGGFEGSRHYIFFGLPGSGKSILLLTMAYHIMKYNQHLRPKAEGKKLCVLYITQENSLKETIQRLWNIAVSEHDITEFSDEEVKEMFTSAGLTLNSSHINLRLIYRKNKSISTDDIYDIIDTLNDEGEEVIAVVHDYVKRINPSKPTNDLRIDLGNVIDEETVIAKTFNIPFITASQINRAGASLIEEAVQKGKENLGKLLTSSNVGESYLMIENTDHAFTIYKEYKTTSDTYYMTFNEIKARSKKTGNNIRYFAHPFKRGNTARLVEDKNLKQHVSLFSLDEDMELNKETALGRGRRGSTSNRKNSVEVTEADGAKAKATQLDFFDSVDVEE